MKSCICAYRRFNSGITPEDYAAIEQALRRRFKGTASEAHLPNVLILLETIEGLGAKRHQALLRRFGGCVN